MIHEPDCRILIGRIQLENVTRVAILQQRSGDIEGLLGSGGPVASKVKPVDPDIAFAPAGKLDKCVKARLGREGRTVKCGIASFAGRIVDSAIVDLP